MQVSNRSDHPIDDSACKAATGKNFTEWYAELDAFDALKKGRRESILYVTATVKDAWWPTTIIVEYETHKGVMKKDGRPEGYTICVTKSISAPVEKTYAVWAAPSQFAEMFGDNGVQTLAEGAGIACDGGCKATFSRIRPNKDLRFVWEHPGCTAPMTVDVQFQDNKGKTLMNVMTSRVQTRAEADGLRDAWSGALTRLKAMAEAV
jgi:uncharacterized protein YndB with AHSA1/START domain